MSGVPRTRHQAEVQKQKQRGTDDGTFAYHSATARPKQTMAISQGRTPDGYGNETTDRNNRAILLRRIHGFNYL